MRSPWIRRASWRLVFFLAASTLLGGVGLPAHADGLTLEQAINLAVQGNKDLQAARYAIAQAHARLTQAGLRPNPRLDLSGKRDFAFKNEGEYTGSISINQQFPIAGRIARQQGVARVDVALAEAEVGGAERTLARDVAATFYRILAFNRQIEVRDQLIAVNQELVTGTRNRFRAAEVSELDVNTAQLELQRLNQERTLLLSQRTTQLAQLNSLLGRPAAQFLELNETLPAYETQPPLEEEQRRALALRPDFRSALLNADRARADQALARAQRWEDWTVGFGYEQDRLVVDGAPPQGTDRSFGLSLSIPLPLLNRNQGRIAEAAAMETQAYARIEALKLNINNEVKSAYAELQRLGEIAQAYQRESLPLSDRNVRLAQRGYKQGQISILEVVQAQRSFSDLNIAYVNAIDQYLQALVRLRYALGGAAGSTDVQPSSPAPVTSP